MALNGLFCADVPLRNYSLTHALLSSSVLFSSFPRLVTFSQMHK